LTLGLGLSFILELFQVFLPERDPSLSDILANSIGISLGFLGYCLWGEKVLSYASKTAKKSKTALSVKKLTLGFIGYVVLTLLISIVLQSETQLRNWDPTFPLVLGNESTGNRPWQGYISELYVANRAISTEEVKRAFAKKGPIFTSIENSLVAAYQLTGATNYYDQMGHLPDFTWQGIPADAQEGEGVFLASDHWLKTTTSVAFLAQKIVETSQFTLSTTVATADIEQVGPARIISISKDPLHRNFMLGQQKTDLVLRLRTPVTGNNGDHPELIIPDVFKDTTSHHLIITYDGFALKVYIDRFQRSYTFELMPKVTVFRYLRPVDQWHIRLNAPNIRVYKLLYYGLIFIPLGFLLALITIISRKGFVPYISLFCGGVFLPALILEGSLAGVSGRTMRLENVLLSVAIATSAIFLFKLRAAPWMKGDMVA
jgi:hypothetical protein